jgi:hypothetical protein
MPSILVWTFAAQCCRIPWSLGPARSTGAMDCSTLSRAREIPIPGRQGGPQPLRSEDHIFGLPSLTGTDVERVTEANQLVEVFGRISQVAHKATAAVVLENPRRAYFWRFPCIQRLQKPHWHQVDYMACSLAAKSQRLLTNVSQLQALACECKHVHTTDEWRPIKLPSGEWFYPTADEQEYTAELAFGIAVALTAWVVQVKGFPIAVPRMPKPLESGDRTTWLDFPSACMRQEAMNSLLCRDSLFPEPFKQPLGVPPFSPCCVKSKSVNAKATV